MQAIPSPDRQGRRVLRLGVAAAALVPLLVLTACGGDDDAAGGGDVKLRLAHSYTEQQPQHRCGAQVIADEVAKANVGLSVEIFPNSQLGNDADRIASVVSGDIDMDIQGASALGAVYEPVSAVDAAYAFDDGEHLKRFFSGPESKALIDGFAAKAKVRTLGAWSAGMRQFTANKPIRKPEDLDGLRMRFPNSPQFLMNAKALGASATEVAYEELFLALQQGTVDGQENPITNIKALNLPEVQDYISMSSHQANSNLVIISDSAWNKLTANFVRGVSKRGRYADGGNLQLQIAKSGTKAWIFAYQRNGIIRSMGLGSVRSVPLALARELAGRAREQLARGIDPIDARRTAAHTQRATRAKLMTFKACTEEYHAANATRWTNAKHRSEWLSTLRRFAFPVIGHLSVDMIDSAHVQKVLAPLVAEKPVTAARVRGR